MKHLPDIDRSINPYDRSKVRVVKGDTPSEDRVEIYDVDIYDDKNKIVCRFGKISLCRTSWYRLFQAGDRCYGTTKTRAAKSRAS